ncbi:hypothetical protein CSB37_00295 [bacterium DOLZORAL124_38_8]|nr:MAG: hypothetical protein CSB37_00295 [bacterium DOLZORAL124_38_8]
MPKKFFFWLIVFFPILLWGYIFWSPSTSQNQILVRQQMLGLKTTNESLFLGSPILAEQLTTFFEPNPIKISHSLTSQTLIPHKFFSQTVNQHLIGILLTPLTDTEQAQLNKSEQSLSFDILITTTSKIPAVLNGKQPTVLANNLPPSKHVNQVYRQAKQPLIWSKQTVRLDLNHPSIKIYQE